MFQISSRNLFVAVLSIAALCAIIRIVHVVTSSALERENTLHATVLAIRVVTEFVADTHRWPRSWSELETVESNWAHYEWPKDASLVRKHVAIDFDVEIDDLQVDEEFLAIRPRRECGTAYLPFIEELLREIHEVKSMATPQPQHTGTGRSLAGVVVQLGLN